MKLRAKLLPEQSNNFLNVLLCDSFVKLGFPHLGPPAFQEHEAYLVDASDHIAGVAAAWCFSQWARQGDCRWSSWGLDHGAWAASCAGLHIQWKDNRDFADVPECTSLRHDRSNGKSLLITGNAQKLQILHSKIRGRPWHLPTEETWVNKVKIALRSRNEGLGHDARQCSTGQEGNCHVHFHCVSRNRKIQDMVRSVMYWVQPLRQYLIVGGPSGIIASSNSMRSPSLTCAKGPWPQWATSQITRHNSLSHLALTVCPLSSIHGWFGGGGTHDKSMRMVQRIFALCCCRFPFKAFVKLCIWERVIDDHFERSRYLLANLEVTIMVTLFCMVWWSDLGSVSTKHVTNNGFRSYWPL